MNEVTKDIIQATAPVIKVNGEKITSTMYRVLFDSHPEAKELF